MPSLQLPLQRAREIIDGFFAGDASLIEPFVAVCTDMVARDCEILVRTNGNILGMGKRREHYRFYIVHTDGRYWIKYKHKEKKELFSRDALDRYLSDNDACHNFFLAYPEEITRQHKRKAEGGIGQARPTPKSVEKILAEWEPIQEKCHKIMASETKQFADLPFAEAVYGEILNMLLDVCEREIRNERDADILKSRTLATTPPTLQQLGDVYGISRERVRQCDAKGWKKITRGIHRNTRAQWVPYRIRLKEILLAIPDTRFFFTLAYIHQQKEALGIWLQEILSPEGEEDAVKQAIHARLYRAAAKKTNSHIPKEAAEQIRASVDIVAYISATLPLRQQGSCYRGTCHFCGVADAFCVYPENTSFHCFACGEGGNVITYQMKAQDLDYPSAVRSLAAFAEIDLEEIGMPSYAEMLRDAALYYFRQFQSNPKASSARSLLSAWGLQGKTVVRLGLGFHDASWRSLITYMTQEKGYTLPQLELACLASTSSHGNPCDSMRNHIIVPTVDENGKVICFDAFSIPKRQWYFSPSSLAFDRSHHLYSYNLAIQAEKKSVWIVTNYEDYFSLAGRGIFNLVSTYAPRITKTQLDLLKRSFQAIVLFTPQDSLAADCQSYCRENDMHFETFDLAGAPSVADFIREHLQEITDRIDALEHILP